MPCVKWIEGLSPGLMDMCPNPEAIILIGTPVDRGSIEAKDWMGIEIEFTLLAQTWVKKQQSIAPDACVTATQYEHFLDWERTVNFKSIYGVLSLPKSPNYFFI